MPILYAEFLLPILNSIEQLAITYMGNVLLCLCLANPFVQSDLQNAETNGSYKKQLKGSSRLSTSANTNK